MRTSENLNVSCTNLAILFGNKIGKKLKTKFSKLFLNLVELRYTKHWGKSIWSFMSFEYRNYVINCIITIKQVGEISFKKLFFIFFHIFWRLLIQKRQIKQWEKKRSSCFWLVCLHLGKQTAESKPKSEMCIQIFNMGSQKPKPLMADEESFWRRKL